MQHYSASCWRLRLPTKKYNYVLPIRLLLAATTTITLVVLLPVFLLETDNVGCCCVVEGLSSSSIQQQQQQHQQQQHQQQQLERRQFFHKAVAVVAGVSTAGAAAGLDHTTTSHNHHHGGGVAHAACLPGDVSKDCIGVYKLPYVDPNESSWLYDKDQLKEFAPDIRYVEVRKQPETIALAKKQLRSERSKIKFVREVVLDGDLEQAGLLLLNLIPAVTSAGLKLQDYVESKTIESTTGNTKEETELRKFQTAFEVLVAEWSSIDIELGFALRGQRGVTAVAQIEVLRYLKDATVALDDFIKLAEQNTKELTSTSTSTSSTSSSTPAT